MDELGDAFASLQLEKANGDQVTAEAAYNSARALLIGLGAGAVALLALLDWLLVRSITGPMSQAIGISRAVSAGDLSLQFEAEGQNEPRFARLEDRNAAALYEAGFVAVERLAAIATERGIDIVSRLQATSFVLRQF